MRARYRRFTDRPTILRDLRGGPTLRQQSLPILFASAATAALLLLAADEAYAPEAEPAAALSCVPEESFAAVPRDPAEAILVKYLSRRFLIAGEATERMVGAAYGGLQNLTLTQAFAVAGEPARESVSIAWNLSFDAGTGLGAFAVGAMATATSYSVAFAVLALAAGLVGGWWAVRA